MRQVPGITEVWLVFSEYDGAGVIVHGAFSSEEMANECAEAMRRAYIARTVTVGGWKLNACWHLSDGYEADGKPDSSAL